MLPTLRGPLRTGRGRGIVIAAAVLVVILLAKVKILVDARWRGPDPDVARAQFTDMKVIKKLNANAARKDEEIAKQRKIIEELREQLAKSPRIDEDGQPARLERLSDRAEVKKAIQGEVFDSSRPGDLHKDRLLPAELPKYWQQHAFKPHGTYGFIQYSGHRSGPRSFSAVGLHTKWLNQSHVLHSCHWKGSLGDYQKGSLRLFVEGEEYTEQYEPAVLQCEVPEATSAEGGVVTAQLDNEEFVMFVEESGKTYALEPQEPFRDQLAFCSTCFHDSMVPQHVWEFMEYHRALHQVDHFYLYDGGAMDEAFRSKVAPYVEVGMATVTDIREILLFSVHYWGQAVALADCVHRTRYTAKWLVMHDVDEYLHVQPPATIHSILAKYAGKPYLTHGMTVWDVEHCLEKKSEDEFIVERMVFRSKTMHCIVPTWEREMCWDAMGHRKLFVDPRQVDIVQVHNVRQRLDGVHMRGGEDMWHYHFRGVGSAYDAGKLCSKSADASPSEAFVRDMEMANIIAVVRQCPLGSKEDCVAKLIEKQREKVAAKQSSTATNGGSAASQDRQL